MYSPSSTQLGHQQMTSQASDYTPLQPGNDGQVIFKLEGKSLVKLMKMIVEYMKTNTSDQVNIEDN
jgi:hypothetical protein